MVLTLIFWASVSPGVYGTDTFESINNEIIEHAMKYEFHCDVYQSNHEGEIIDKLHLARKNYERSYT